MERGSDSLHPSLSTHLILKPALWLTQSQYRYFSRQFGIASRYLVSGICPWEQLTRTGSVWSYILYTCFNNSYQDYNSTMRFQQHHKTTSVNWLTLVWNFDGVTAISAQRDMTNQRGQLSICCQNLNLDLCNCCKINIPGWWSLADVVMMKQLNSMSVSSCYRTHRNMPLLLELALLEEHEGNVTEARRLFQRAEDPQSPAHPPLIDAYIAFERAQHNYEKAEHLLNSHRDMLNSRIARTWLASVSNNQQLGLDSAWLGKHALCRMHGIGP